MVFLGLLDSVALCDDGLIITIYVFCVFQVVLIILLDIDVFFPDGKKHEKTIGLTWSHYGQHAFFIVFSVPQAFSCSEHCFIPLSSSKDL